MEKAIAAAMTFPPLDKGGPGGVGTHANDTVLPPNSLPAMSGTTPLRLAGLPPPGENFAANHLEHTIDVIAHLNSYTDESIN